MTTLLELRRENYVIQLDSDTVTLGPVQEIDAAIGQKGPAPAGSPGETRRSASQSLHRQPACAAPYSVPAAFSGRSRCANMVDFGSRA